MGVARLLAKGWVLVCLFAGAHALRFALGRRQRSFTAVPPADRLRRCCSLPWGCCSSAAMALRAAICASPVSRLPISLPHALPGFNEIVFLFFVCLSFLNQIVVAPAHLSGTVVDGFESAIFASSRRSWQK